LSGNRDAGDFSAALEYAEQLAKLVPNDPNLAALIENLRDQIKNPRR
jgi:hypothetical protein